MVIVTASTLQGCFFDGFQVFKSGPGGVFFKFFTFFLVAQNVVLNRSFDINRFFFKRWFWSKKVVFWGEGMTGFHPFEKVNIQGVG